MTNCEEIDPTDFEPVGFEVRLTTGYQSSTFCSVRFEGEESVDIDIIVNRIAIENGVVRIEEFRTVFFSFLTNDDEFPGNLNFDNIPVPDRGFFEITVKSKSSCSNCCDENPEDSPDTRACDNSLDDEFGGKPKWEGTSRRLDAADMPLNVTVFPRFTGCDNCGTCID